MRMIDAAMCLVRPVEQVTVVSRSREAAERLAARARAQGLEARVGGADAAGVGFRDSVRLLLTESQKARK